MERRSWAPISCPGSIVSHTRNERTHTKKYEKGYKTTLNRRESCSSANDMAVDYKSAVCTIFFFPPPPFSFAPFASAPKPWVKLKLTSFPKASHDRTERGKDNKPNQSDEDEHEHRYSCLPTAIITFSLEPPSPREQRLAPSTCCELRNSMTHATSFWFGDKMIDERDDAGGRKAKEACKQRARPMKTASSRIFSCLLVRPPRAAGRIKFTHRIVPG